MRPEEACYREVAVGDKLTYRPVTDHRDRAGFRLPTDREFDAICSAGTKPRRYFGDSSALLDRYACILKPLEGLARPVAGKRPNDLGFFDTLGNIQEWCERTGPQGAAGSVSGDLRGGWFGGNSPGKVDRFSVVPGVPLDFGDPTMGLRVVRTKVIP